MTSLASSAGSQNPDQHSAFEPRDYIPLILRTMDDKRLHIRDVALRTGISKSRLGLLLHRDPEKRPNISFIELQKVLNALDLSIMQAIISVEASIDETVVHDERFATLLAMLSELFSGLPAMLIQALDEIDGIDGTEIRREWAVPLREAMVEKLVKEVTSIMARRAVMTQTSRLGL